MTREEFYKLTDILNSEVLGNFMHGGEADELIAMFEEAVEHSNILEQEEPVSEDEAEKQFNAGDVVMYVSRHPAYSGLYLLGNPNDLSIGYSNANEPYQIVLRNCTVSSEDERKQFMRELNDNGYKWNESTLSIEEQEPVSDGLEKEMDSYFLKMSVQEHENIFEDTFKNIARHFAKWQKTKDESTTEDLGEYINELSKQFPEVSFAKLSRIAVRVSKWQKEHQAEKDLELTWQDMFDIYRLVNEVLDDDYAEGKTKKEIGEEVLNRFKDLKERKEK